ncbi:hypothetical protein MRB53_016137 [Persea americana]|uniref:Uncharacterized protein n=1 Tax=Persea americana TaxID=3435 RepID=A0ACC2M1B5_PERAE|nr:hypothetical protein MRB53_016137 [Persea americana]
MGPNRNDTATPQNSNALHSGTHRSSVTYADRFLIHDWWRGRIITWETRDLRGIASYVQQKSITGGMLYQKKAEENPLLRVRSVDVPFSTVITGIVSTICGNASTTTPPSKLDSSIRFKMQFIFSTMRRPSFQLDGISRHHRLRHLLSPLEYSSSMAFT